MLEIKSVLDKFYEVKRPRSQRAVILQMFLNKLIEERGGKKFYVKGNKRIPLAPITAVSLGARLAHIATSDLEYIYSICKHAQSFSRMFWFMTRTKTLA